MDVSTWCRSTWSRGGHRSSGRGRSNTAIATRLVVALKTVASHIANIFTKLGLEDAPDDHRRVLAVLTALQRASEEGGANAH